MPNFELWTLLSQMSDMLTDRNIYWKFFSVTLLSSAYPTLRNRLKDAVAIFFIFTVNLMFACCGVFIMRHRCKLKSSIKTPIYHHYVNATEWQHEGWAIINGQGRKLHPQSRYLTATLIFLLHKPINWVLRSVLSSAARAIYVWAVTEIPELKNIIVRKCTHQKEAPLKEICGFSVTEQTYWFTLFLSCAGNNWFLSGVVGWRL
jgi:hypothetical protein